MKKESGFFDFLKPPEIPRFLRPEPSPNYLGMGRKPKSKKKDLKSTQRKELDMWHEWNQKGRDPNYLKPLHQSFKPVINRQVQKWSDAPVPKSAIYHEMNKQFVNAVKSYDPSKGTQLNTWITTNLRKAGRFVRNYQNLGRIPEAQISKIRPYQKAKEELEMELGYEPDTKTIADRMGESPRHIAQLEMEMREDLATSNFQDDPASVLAPKELEALNLVQYDLIPEERTVYEYTFGMNGRPALKPGEISKKTGISPSKVSRIRKKLQSKVEEAMEVL